VVDNIGMTTPELRRHAKKVFDRLSPERLRVAADFLDYLSERDGATEELLRIPGILKAVENAESEIAARRVSNWRKIRRDV
jgi:hypothetical protein